MKFARLIFRNAFRSPVRSIMTVCLMMAIFFLVATLLAIVETFERSDTGGTGDRLVVQSAFSLANMLPFSDEEKIRRVPGVVDVAKSQWVGGYYKDERNFITIMAVDADKLGTVFPDYAVPQDQLDAFVHDRQGAIVGEEVMKKYGWKVGDRIHIKRQIFPLDPELTIRGVHHHPIQRSMVWFQMPYFQESIGRFSKCGTFWLKVANPNDMPRISQEIDALFKNSEDPTETYTEKEFTRQFVSMMGNIKLLFNAVSFCSIAMVILLAAITMSMSARERVTEVAVLKAIGYPPGLVMRLMLTEFVTLSLIGGGIGTLLAVGFYRVVDMNTATQGMLPNFQIDPKTIATCIVFSILVGIFAGGLPSWRSAQLTVVDGLRRVV